MAVIMDRGLTVVGLAYLVLKALQLTSLFRLLEHLAATSTATTTTTTTAAAATTTTTTTTVLVAVLESCH